MTNRWLKMIDSAQRTVALERPKSPSHPALRGLTFDIQGLTLVGGGGNEILHYSQLAECGTTIFGARPLTVWQRLRRRPTPVGKVESQAEQVKFVSFWSQPALELLIDLADETVASSWRECEIMILSAGFTLIGDTLVKPVY